MSTIPFEGDGALWRAGTVYCLGKNFRAHAVEMGQIEEKPPVVFLKPAAALVVPHEVMVIPTDRGEVHPEVELVLAIDPAGRGSGEPLSNAQAARTIVAYTIGLDLTLRDEQSAAKAAGDPWSASKGFPGSAPIAPLMRCDRPPRWSELTLTLEVNGERRQQASLEEMTLAPAACVAHLSTHFPLEAGDLVFTGTPAGVAPIAPGDRLVASLTGGPWIEVRVVGNALPR